MILKANLVEALRSLASSKQRTLLALIGIVIGIGSVIAMVSVGMIVKAETLKQFTSMGTNILTISKGFGSEKGPAGKQLSLSAALAIPEHCPSCLLAAPYTSAYGDVRYNREKNQTSAMGVTGQAADIYKLHLSEGRFLSDLDKYMFFCVLTSSMADWLRENGMTEAVGTQITFADRIFTVVGVLKEVPSGGMRPYELTQGILIPITTAMRLPNRPQLSGVTVRIAPGATPDGATAEIRHYFSKRQKGLNIRVQSAQQIIQGMQKQMQMFTLLLGAIGSISLIVGGVGVMNVMLVSVSERKKEIGIRRALGALQSDILAQFLIESLVLSFTGGILGIVLGVGAAWVISHFSGWTFFVSSMPIVLGVGVSAAVGVFFGLYPARKAARLKPIDALRAE